MTKELPHSIEAEQSVLGCILLDNNAIYGALENLAHEDFYKHSHRRIFKAMLDMFNNGNPIDIVTLTSYLIERKELEVVGGASYLANLAEMVPTAYNVEMYTRIVKEKALVRRTILASMEIAEKGFSHAGPADHFLDEAENTIFNASITRIKPSFKSVGEVLKETFEYVENKLARKNQIIGVATGFADLDRITGGLHKQDLIIIAARPSMGKTAFCLDIARYVATERDIPVALFSLEMGAEQLVLRLLCQEAMIDGWSLRRGFITKEEMPVFINAAARLSSIPLFIDDSASLSVLEIRAKARRMMLENKLGLVIIDYLQLLRGVGNLENREKEISSISRSLKALAKELDLPVVALSQLNRAVEGRVDKRPLLADLRESGAIEQDADLIAFIYRDEVYNKDTTDKNMAEIIVGKHRNGPTGMVKLRFTSQYTRFDSLETVYDNYPEAGY